VLRHRSGDQQAVEEIIAYWERPLFYYIRRLVISEQDAWDALQEVWLNMIRRIAKLRDPRALPAWLYSVAHNAAISHLRKNPSFEPLPEEDQRPGIPDDEVGPSFQCHEAALIHWGLDQLNRPHREVLSLHFLEGFTLAEIAGIVGAPVGTVKSRMHHAKKTLRHILDQEAYRHE
jgi:RNA polymerase sigma-70 factor (ECF subfamily)